jgi:hypothetical protein
LGIFCLDKNRIATFLQQMTFKPLKGLVAGGYIDYAQFVEGVNSL